MDRNATFGRRLVEAGYPALDMPSIADQGLVRGRYPSEGYARGWGLDFSALDAQVEAHPLYRDALEASAGRSVMARHRMMNLFLIIAYYFDALDHHNIVEFGSYRGGSALFMAYLLKQLYPAAGVYAHDTFVGMPPTDKTADLHGEGDFSDLDLPGLLARRAELSLFRLKFTPGYVQNTFPGPDTQDITFGLAHFDMDIYEPTAYAQEVAWSRMCRGGYYVYDDATVSSCLGATLAVEELILARRVHSEQIYPHFVFRVGL